LNIAQAKIHFVVRIGKNPVIQDTLQESIRLLTGVGFLNRNQGHNACADYTDVYVVYGNFGLGNALDDADHGDYNFAYASW